MIQRIWRIQEFPERQWLPYHQELLEYLEFLDLLEYLEFLESLESLEFLEFLGHPPAGSRPHMDCQV
jgi:hypothetical protein